MENNIEITENAAKRICFLMEKEKSPDSKLRISVDGGGCSGFQYDFKFDSNINDDDQVINMNGASLVIDEISQGFMENSILDYVETLGAAHFEVKNPNATATCGCGNSFSV